MFHPSSNLAQLLAAIAQGSSPLQLYGLSPAALAWSITKLWLELRRPILLTTPTAAQQITFLRDMSFFLAGYDEAAPDNRNVLYAFPHYESLPFVELTPDFQTASSRLEAAYTLSTQAGIPIIVATGIALVQPLPPRDQLAANTEYLVVGEELDRERFLSFLEAGGYSRRPLVEEQGDYSVRGGVIDFFPPLSADPVRLEFWGDNIDSIRHFSASTQRSSKHLEDVIVLPVSEVFLDVPAQKLASHRLRSSKNTRITEYLQRREHFPRIERYLACFYDKTETMWDYLPENCLVVNWDPLNLKQELDTYRANLEQDRQSEEATWPGNWLEGKFPWQTLSCHAVPFGVQDVSEKNVFYFSLQGNQELAASLAAEAVEPGRLTGPLAARMRQWQDSGFQTVLVCRSRSQAERLNLLLGDRQLTAELTANPRWQRPGTIQLTWDGLSAGFQWLAEALIILTEEEVLGAVKEAPKRKTARPLQFFSSLNDLKVGDPIVHLDHGIGLFRGLVKLTLGNEINDFLYLQYLGGDKLYLPVDRL
ncbi:MAG TPA: CarD family transcriptional regulator, partial [Thermodesulfobacteriota bacterium]|nr:CarD family transcriptional regulator [Thermodesulfobacteriota bacterium]